MLSSLCPQLSPWEAKIRPRAVSLPLGCVSCSPQTNWKQGGRFSRDFPVSRDCASLEHPHCRAQEVTGRGRLWNTSPFLPAAEPRRCPWLWQGRAGFGTAAPFSVLLLQPVPLQPPALRSGFSNQLQDKPAGPCRGVESPPGD